MGYLTTLLIFALMILEQETTYSSKAKTSSKLNKIEQHRFSKEIDESPAQKYISNVSRHKSSRSNSLPTVKVICMNNGTLVPESNGCMCPVDYPAGTCELGHASCQKIIHGSKYVFKCKCPPGIAGRLCLDEEEICRPDRALNRQNDCRNEYIATVTRDIICPPKKLITYLREQLSICLDLAAFETGCHLVDVSNSKNSILRAFDASINQSCETSSCINGGTYDRRSRLCTCPPGYDGRACSHRLTIQDCCTCPNPPLDCHDFYERGYRTDGVFKICLGDRHEMEVSVYCDMANGGWTVIQKRSPQKNVFDDFQKTWNEYRDGFGNPLYNYWIGNKHIFFLTNKRTYVLKVTLTSYKEEAGELKLFYSNFIVEDEMNRYRLHYSCYTGMPGENGFEEQVNYAFSTHDVDNTTEQCAYRSKGGWWFNHCCVTNLNGIRVNYSAGIEEEPCNGILWAGEKKRKYEYVQMSIKFFNLTN